MSGNSNSLLTRLPFIGCGLLTALLGLSSTGHALLVQDVAPAADMNAFMKEMMLAEPGPEHAELAKLAGAWNLELVIQMAPETAPEKETAEASAKMILGGRFLEISTSGDFMGMPIESLGYLGYDRRTEQYNVMGMDTLGTYWVTAKGQRDEDGIIRLHGEDDSPSGKQVFTYEYDFSGPDGFEQRLLFTQLGHQAFDEPFAMMTSRYTRKSTSSRFAEVDHGAPTTLDSRRVAKGESLKAAVVETSCGQCQFDLPGDSCDLAVRVGDTAWFVTGTSIDEHGDAHATDGFCNSIRQARVSGHVEEGRFFVTKFELLPDVED